MFLVVHAPAHAIFRFRRPASALIPLPCSRCSHKLCWCLFPFDISGLAKTALYIPGGVHQLYADVTPSLSLSIQYATHFALSYMRRCFHIPLIPYIYKSCIRSPCKHLRYKNRIFSGTKMEPIFLLCPT
jgi:hypothetical protein